MENIEIINPDDKDYYDGKLYKVGIWPGAGYQLVEFYVYASDESTALDLVVVDAEINAPNLLYSIDEVMNQITDDFQDEYVEFKNEYEDADDFTFAQEYLNYIYVDATMEGASQPYFVNGENLVIEEVQDIKEENKKEEKVKDYVFVIYRPRLTKSPIYVSGPSTETENIDEAITFDTEYDAQEYRDNLELSYKEQYKIGVKNLEENKEVKNENEEVPYDNTTEKECPKCHKKYTQFPAISRRDNKTYICPQCGVDEAIEDMLKNKKDENKEVKKENKVRFDGGYLNVVMENITEQEFWNYIQDIENTLEGETYVGESTTVAWYDGVYQREIYSLDDTENASKFVYYSSEYNEDTNETLYTIYEFPNEPDDGKTLKKEDYDTSDIVWEDFEKYSQEEINEIRDILNNLDVEAINNDGHSVAVKIKSNGMVFWIDYSLDGQDIVGDWNQYIFDNTNSDDRIRQAIQTSYYESTGDALAFDVMESAGLEYLEKNGVVVYTDEGYRFNDNLKENKKLNEKYNLKNIFDNISKIVDYALAESFYKVFENDLDDNGNIKLSKKEIQSKLSDFIKQHKEDYQINELKQLLNSNFGLEEIKTEAIKDDTELENKQIKESKFDKLSKKMTQKGKKTESLLKEDKQFPITLKNANVIDFKGIPVEIIYNFDSVQEMVNIYVEQTGKSIDVLNKEEIDYNLINTDFSHTTLTKYELIKENENKFYIIEELWGAGDEIGATLYLSNEEIKTTDINDLILQADEASRATLHKQESLLKETNYTFLSPQTIGDYSNGTIEAQSVVNCKDAEDCKNKAKKFKVDVETVEPGETGYIATMKGNLQDICNFIAGKKVNMYDFMEDENTSVMLFKENKIQETNDVKSEFKLKHLCAGCDKDMGFSDKTFCDECEKNLSDEEKKAAIRKVMGDFTITENKTITEEMTSDEAKQKFIDFCKGKVKDLGTIDAKDGNTYKILLTSDSYKQAQPEAYLTQDDDYLIVIDKLGEVVINSDMDTIMTDVGELDFTAIDTELYNEILDNWEDYDLADDFTYRADADIQYDKIKEMAKQLPAEIKYNTIERNGGVDVEMYVDNMPNIKASTTTMKGTEYVQDSFDIDGLWQVTTLDDNGEFNNYEYVTGWQEAVKLMQEQMPKVKKENKELQEDVNEEITLANIKQKAQEILPAEDIDTHYGDLYIKVSDKSTELVNKMKDKDSGLIEIFTSEIDGQQWYDIPFANWNDDYNKLNEAQEGTLSVELNTGVLPIVNVDMYSMGELINDYDVTQEELDEIVMELAPEYIEDTLKDILADVSIVVESVYHPSQYNFSGDELEFTLNVSRSSYESLKETTLQDDKFKSFLKQNYSSYDGFVSYMADSIDDFETQDEWKQVVQVIMFNIPENVIEYNNESYINTFIDKLSSNYPMIEDEDSLDESKKVTENKDKWMEDYEELDGMIIGYLEDHNIKLSKEQQDKVLDDLAVSGILDVFDDFKSNDKIVDKTIESAIKKVTNNLDEKLLGPSDDVIADSKAKGLYTEAQEDKDLDVVNYNITDGGYKNNAKTVYGILTDGTYFVYYPEMDLVETYDCEPDELIDILYASEDEMPDEARTEAYNDFFEQHNVNTYTEGPLFDKLHKLYFEDEDLLDESKKVEKKQPMSSNIEKMVSRVEALEKEYDKSNRDMTEKELCADVKKIIEDIYGIKIPDIKLTTLLQNGLGYRFKISQNINKYLKEPLDTAITLDVYFSEKTKVDSFTLDPETDLETWGLKDDDRVSFKSNNEDTKVDDSKIYVLVMNNFIYWEGTEEEFDRDDDAAYELAIQNAIADGVEDAYDIDRSDFELMTKEELKKELKRINAIKDETKEILEKWYKKITEDVNIDDEDSLDESKKAEDEELSDTLVKLNDEMHTYLFKIYHKEIIPSEDEAIEKIKSIIKNIYNIDIPLTFTVWPNANGKPNYDGSIDKMSENLNQYLKELVDSIYLTLNIKDEKVTHIGLWIDELEFDENGK